MKASELIAELLKAIAEHGDLEVYMHVEVGANSFVTVSLDCVEASYGFPEINAAYGECFVAY